MDVTRAILILACAALASNAWADPTPSITAALAQLKSLAAERSPEIRIARATLAQKRAQTYTSWARWVPRLDLQLTQSRELNYSLITSGQLGAFAQQFQPVETPLAGWSFNLTEPLYKRSVHLGVEQAAAEKSVAENDFEQRMGELDWRMRSLLGKYILERYRSETLKTSLEIANTSLREAKLRFELGQRTRIDVLKAQANVVDLESQRISNEQLLKADLSSFLEYAGINSDEFRSSGFAEPLSGEQEISQSIDEFTSLDMLEAKLGSFLGSPAKDPALHERVSAQLAQASPVLRGYVSQQNLDVVRARTVMAQEFPELDLQGSYSKQGAHWSDALSAGQESHSIAVVLTIPIFSGGSTVSTFLEKNNAQKATELKFARDAERLRDDVENELLKIEALRKLVESNKLSLTQNEEIVRLSFKSYQLGKTTMVELLGSQNDLINAKIKLAQSKLDLADSLRKYAWDLGVPLE